MSGTLPSFGLFCEELDHQKEGDPMQELNNAKTLLKNTYSKYSKYKILYDCIQETADCPKCDFELKTKVQDILLEQECLQTSDVGSLGFSQNSNTLLGLTSLGKTELNITESLKLKGILKSALQEKYDNICKHFYKLTGKSIHSVEGNSFDLKMSSDDNSMFELMEELKEQQKKYVKNLLQQQEILEKLVHLRLETLPQVCDKKIKECETQTRMHELRTKMVNEKTRIEIFMETSHSLPAYEKLIQDIREQIKECESDIQYLEHEKEKYKQVESKQFDDILKTFVQYKKAIEKMKLISETLS